MTPNTVLVFDESGSLRSAIGGHLSSRGAAVRLAATASEAAAAIESGGVDVAIIRYPTDSPAVVGLLRGAVSAAAVPVVLITGADAIRSLPAEVLPVVTEVLARGRFSRAELERVLDKLARGR